MDIAAIIFDKDGTLFDFQTTWGAWTNSVIDYFADGDPTKRDALVARLKYDAAAKRLLPESLVVAGTPAEIASEISGVVGLDADAVFSKLNALAARAPQAVVPGIEGALQRLKDAGLKLAVMTNDAEMPARANLETGGLTGFFDVIVGSDSGYGAKPTPDPLLSIAGIIDVPPAQCLMVGDSLHDLHAGQAAGMGTVAVLTGLAQQAELSPFATVVLPSAAGLPDWLQTQSVN